VHVELPDRVGKRNLSRPLREPLTAPAKEAILENRGLRTMPLRTSLLYQPGTLPSFAAMANPERRGVRGGPEKRRRATHEEPVAVLAGSFAVVAPPDDSEEGFWIALAMQEVSVAARRSGTMRVRYLEREKPDDPCQYYLSTEVIVIPGTSFVCTADVGRREVGTSGASFFIAEELAPFYTTKCAEWWAAQARFSERVPELRGVCPKCHEEAPDSEFLLCSMCGSGANWEHHVSCLAPPLPEHFDMHASAFFCGEGWERCREEPDATPVPATASGHGALSASRRARHRR
jgi:hypothetical protein